MGKKLDWVRDLMAGSDLFSDKQIHDTKLENSIAMSIYYFFYSLRDEIYGRSRFKSTIVDEITERDSL